MKYIVTMNERGEFTGFCARSSYEQSPGVFVLEDETFEEFEGPAYDGADETYNEVKRLAQARCKPDPV